MSQEANRIWIVVRRPVNWLEFREEDSIAFCRAVNYPETTIVDFCTIWHAHMRCSFQEVRHRLASIAHRSWMTVPRASIVSPNFLDDVDIEPTDQIILTDDDDWLGPGVASVEPNSVWGSLALVKVLYPPERLRDPVLLHRPLDGFVYTNNSSISGETLTRWSLPKLFEHSLVDAARWAGDIKFDLVPTYLSCANKHPCCATVALLNMKSSNLDIIKFVRDYVEALQNVDMSEAAWLRPYVAEVIAVFQDCLPPG